MITGALPVGSDLDARFGPGRYVLGPPNAKVPVAFVPDYQCPSCRGIYTQLRAMTAGRDDLTISARHFPFCTDCNEHVDKSRLPNAFRAAIAAEAAGIAGCTDAFWKLHAWLFERGGQFTDEELLEIVRENNMDETEFREALVSQDAVAIV